ncbi:hypothetical protein V496_08218 [Pseudogymnoascus sp. VKM F-4515 (FW-2607)]|nr:hypothetical protein V496_08218 [Pseudogymnoascus sp. VKM F-4515 (FW-2607)]KFY95533.1 hypothetical protein V498_03305 [Pseudogymnoascus sp. VKM F-4517 (FW-2822)]
MESIHSIMDGLIANDDDNPAGLQYLPAELIEAIFQHLGLDSCKSFRLTSKRCAVLGQPYILSSQMKLFPHRDDFTKLMEISQHPYFSSQIQRVEIYMAKADDYHFRNNMCVQQCALEVTGNVEMMQKSLARYQKQKGLEEAFADDFCNPDILEQAFPNMKNLEAIDIKMEDCLYNDHVLWDAWKMGLSKAEPGATEIDHFMAVLRAASRSKLRILTNDLLPFGIWDMDCYRPDLEAAFSGLTTLKLIMGCKNLRDHHVTDDRESWANKLNKALKGATNLRELHIGFKLSFSAVLDCPPLLDGLVLPHLHTLILEKLAWRPEDLIFFLKAHAATLRRLRVWAFVSKKDLKGNTVDFPADLEKLVDEMKEHLQLEKLDVCGHPSIHCQPAEIFWFHEMGLYDENWEPVKQHSGSLSVMAKRCEEYVVHNGQSPYERVTDDLL